MPRVVLVTAAAAEIGLGTAQAFADTGDTAVLTDLEAADAIRVLGRPPRARVGESAVHGIRANAIAPDGAGATPGMATRSPRPLPSSPRGSPRMSPARHGVDGLRDAEPPEGVIAYEIVRPGDDRRSALARRRLG